MKEIKNELESDKNVLEEAEKADSFFKIPKVPPPPPPFLLLLKGLLPFYLY